MSEHPDRLLATTTQPVEDLTLEGRRVSRGDRVRLHPRARGDVFDLVLDGKTAAVESVEQDLEGKFLVAVVLEEDPGIFLGLLRQPGHRFFFAPEEIEPLDGGATDPVPAPTRRILVAGIGNIFHGDDGFGVEVARRLATRDFPQGVTVTDYGIRGYDLAYALMEAPDRTILIDACPRGEPPGTVFLLQPDLADLDGAADGVVLDAHDMNPLHVLRLARAFGAVLRPVVIVGCEPETLGPPEGQLGMSEPVQRAVDEAVTLVESLIARYLTGGDEPAPHTSP